MRALACFKALEIALMEPSGAFSGFEAASRLHPFDCRGAIANIKEQGLQPQ
jgi:hypothetical protein